MRFDQLRDMHIIADAGAVGRIAIDAMHGRALPRNRVEHERDQKPVEKLSNTTGVNPARARHLQAGAPIYPAPPLTGTVDM